MAIAHTAGSGAPNADERRRKPITHGGNRSPTHGGNRRHSLSRRESTTAGSPPLAYSSQSGPNPTPIRSVPTPICDPQPQIFSRPRRPPVGGQLGREPAPPVLPAEAGPVQPKRLHRRTKTGINWCMPACRKKQRRQQSGPNIRLTFVAPLLSVVPPLFFPAAGRGRGPLRGPQVAS